jgi:hypothetical protein
VKYNYCFYSSILKNPGLPNISDDVDYCNNLTVVLSYYLGLCTKAWGRLFVAEMAMEILCVDA